MSSHMRSRSTNRCILSADYMPGTELSSKLKVKLSSKLSLTLSKCSVNVTYLSIYGELVGSLAGEEQRTAGL